MLDQPHHDGSARYVPEQVPTMGSWVTVFVAVPKQSGVDSVFVRSAPDGEPRFSPAVIDSGAIPCDWDSTPVIGTSPETPYQLYGGDLDGIVDHLDHIESLGFNTLYLTPVFPARSNHRYDASTFDHVDPLLGGDEALARLTSAAHRRGLRVIGDITTNHCGDGHPWFRSAAAGSGAVEREMFYFDGDDYEAWYGVKSLPKLNWGSAELRRRFFDGPQSVVRRWLSAPYSLDGWRVDVANMTGRRGGDAYTHEVAALLRRAMVDECPAGSLIAEHNDDAAGDLDHDGRHGTMNYAGFLRPLWTWLRAESLSLPDFIGVPVPVPHRDGVETLNTLRMFAAGMSWRSLTSSWTLLGSHDSARIRTVVGDAARVEVALGLLIAYPGVPMVFAGDEFALEGVNGEEARRPMPWARPRDESMLSRYRHMIGPRRVHEPLRHGGLRWAYADRDALAFLRESADGRLLVYARRRPGQPVVLAGAQTGTADNVYGGAAAEVTDDGAVWLPGDGPTFQVWAIGPQARPAQRPASGWCPAATEQTI